MKTNIIVICKQKLISVDSILPVLLELKDKNSTADFFVVLPDNKTTESVKKNYHILEALSGIGADILEQSRSGRITLLFWTFKFFCRLAFRRNIIFPAGDCLYKHRMFMRLLKKVSSTVEIRFSLLAPVRDFIENLKIQRQYIEELAADAGKSAPPGGSKQDKADYDYFLSSVSYEDVSVFTPEPVSSEKMIKAGYVRALPAWLRFVESASSQWMELTRHGKYCLFILSTFGKRVSFYNEPDVGESFKETLDVLKRFSERLHVVFKPHAITDMKQFETYIEDAGFKNYSVDYGHPMVLAANAEFVIGNTFSNTMFDAFYLNRPVIEYTSYDKELFSRIGNCSIGGRCCGKLIERDQSLLEKTLENILDGKSDFTFSTSFLNENFPPPDREFTDFFEKLLIYGHV